MLFFFNVAATPEIYTLSLHDALPICEQLLGLRHVLLHGLEGRIEPEVERDRKSTRLNSSHTVISYAVFCLKKKNRIHGFRIVVSSHTSFTRLLGPSLSLCRC